MVILSLNEVIQDFCLSENQWKFQYYLDIEDNIFIKFNQDSAKQIITNIVSNAIKYTSDKRIEVGLSKDKDKVLFSVSNKISDDTAIDIKKFGMHFMLPKSQETQNYQELV